MCGKCSSISGRSAGQAQADTGSERFGNAMSAAALRACRRRDPAAASRGRRGGRGHEPLQPLALGRAKQRRAREQHPLREELKGARWVAQLRGEPGVEVGPRGVEDVAPGDGLVARALQCGSESSKGRRESGRPLR